MIRELLLISTLLVPNIQNKNSAKDPLVFFEYTVLGKNPYTQFEGEIIDTQGWVHHFKAKNKEAEPKFQEWKEGAWNDQSSDWEMTLEDAEHNLSLCDLIVCKADPDSVSKYAHLLSLIAQRDTGKDNPERHPPATQEVKKYNSVTKLYGFIYDADRHKYKRMLYEYYIDGQPKDTSVYISRFNQWKWCK